MKKMNFLIMLLVVIVGCLFTTNVSARTSSVIDFIFEYPDEGDCVYRSSTVNYTDFLSKNVVHQEWLSTYTVEDFAVVELLFKVEELKKQDLGISYEVYMKSITDDEITLYDPALDYTETCKIVFKDEKEIDLEEHYNELKDLKNPDQLMIYESLNSIYHYGTLIRKAHDFSFMLFKFPELKEFFLEHQDYKVVPVADGGGSTPVHEGCGMWLGFYKGDNLVYVHYLEVTASLVLPVDRTKSGTVYERALDVVKDYFGKNVNIKLEPLVDPNTNMNEFVPGAQKALGTTKVDDSCYIATLELGDKKTDVCITEGDADYVIDKYEVSAHDKKTDVNVYTDSYEVPLDATLKVEKEKDKDYVLKAFGNKKFHLLEAYDISVIKTENGSYVSKIENGIEVYIPIKNKRVGDKVRVHHVKDSGELGEEFEGSVININGNLYVKFITTHFSTYALSDKVNPNTYDNISTYVILFMISVMGMLGTVKVLRKNN